MTEKQLRELADIKHTMMMNFGKEQGRIAKIIKPEDTATRMFVDIIVYLKTKGFPDDKTT